MVNIIEETEIYVKLNKDDFLHFIHYEENTPVFEFIKNKFEILEYAVQNAVKAKARFVTGFYQEEEAYHVLLTLGEEIDRLIADKNDNGDYLEAYLINAMADWYLFLADEKLQHTIFQICKEGTIGIKKRMEPFHELKPEYQKDILRITKGHEWGLSITKGYMFYPQKTMGYVLLLDKQQCIFPKGHNCKSCENMGCSYRKP